MEIPSRQMLLLNLGEADLQLGSAIAMNTLVFVVARMVGPAIAAMMFEPVGPLGAFLLAALGLAFMTGCVMRMRPRAPLPGGLAAGRGGFSGAVAFARRDGFASLMLPVLVCLALCASSYQTFVPVLAERVFGDATRWSGWFFATAGGGALVAALLLSSLHAEALSRRLLLASPWFAALALVLIGAIRHPLGVLPAFALLGFCTSFCATATNAGLHRRGPPEARGGLIGLFLMAFTGMGPVAQLLAGGLAQYLPVAQTLYVLASLLAASLLLVYGRRWWQLQRLELDAGAL
jgi:predicted MFS family arabinose efflux permease